MAEPRQSRVFLVGGLPGSGKSTVSKLLASRFDRGLYIPWDVIREDWVVSGRLLPWEGDPGDAGQQMMLGTKAAFKIAEIYADGGFNVVVDGPLPPIPEVVPLVLEEARYLDPLAVYLHPRLEVILQRLRGRSGGMNDDFHLQGTPISYQNLERIRVEGWPVSFVDSSELTPEQTVDAILEIASGRHPI